MLNATSTWTSLVLASALALALVGCSAKSAPPDFRVLRAPPVMSEKAEQQAVDFEDAARAASIDPALPDFAWACDAYGAYIEELREGQP
ncbi:MAG: hypothetical protein WBG86_16040 [Polyangiales bacterium]